MVPSVICSVFIVTLVLNLVETWSVLDPPADGCVQKTVNGDRCSFPFIYNGYQFLGCTDYEFSQFWCSIDREFQGRRALCLDGVECSSMDITTTLAPDPQSLVAAPQMSFIFCKSRTTEGTGAGAACAPWYVYKGINYTDCTNEDSTTGRPWCSMTSIYNNIWGFCTIPEEDCLPFCKSYTESGPAGGAPCEFPFSYKGQIYTECTTADNKSHWCSTSQYYRENSWGFCAYNLSCAATTAISTTRADVRSQTSTQYCLTRTIDGTGDGAACAPTFTYRGLTFRGCILVDNPRPWCSTTPTYSGSWGVCLAIDACFPFCTDRTYGGTSDGSPCVLPFVYKGQTYNNCTTRDHIRHWCGTTGDSSQWGNCVYASSCDTRVSPTPYPPTPAPTLPSSIYCLTRTVLGKGGNGAPCVIPFSYKGVVYNDCILVDNPRPWCSTTQIFNGAWGVCLTNQECAPFCPTLTELGTANGAPCFFPFSYNGVEYDKCTTIDHFRHWCATKYLFDRNSWGNCIYGELGSATCPLSPTPQPVTPTTSDYITPTTQDRGAYGLYCLSKTYGGNADGYPCADPFVYNNVSYRGCIPDGSGAWCSTTPVFSGKFGKCYYNNECAPFCTGSTFGGNADGVPCVFPFVYRGVAYDHCITRDHPNTQQWCSVTPTYSGLWGNCIYALTCPVIATRTTSPTGFCLALTVDGNAFNEPCAPSWTYKGRTYTDCTYDDNPRPWCSTTPNYEADRKWGVCREGDCPGVCPYMTERGTAGGAPCVFPFRYKGVNYTACTTVDNRGYYWCSTTAEFSGSWGKCIFDPCPYCPDRTVGGTALGSPCAPSWNYKGKTFSGCIQGDRERIWCSTTQAYSGVWGECLDPNCRRFCNDRTVLGTAGGAPCVFPFTYKNVEYTSCTTKDHFRLWCAIDPNYNNNWGNCVYEC